MTTTEQCQHHYIIDMPGGSHSPGRCKKCGVEKQFANWLTDYYISDFNSGDGSKQRRGRLMDS